MPEIMGMAVVRALNVVLFSVPDSINLATLSHPPYYGVAAPAVALLCSKR
jgi:hypothetical protein